MAGKTRQTRCDPTAADLRAAVRRLLEDRAYRSSLKRRLMQGRAPHLEVLLHLYAYGAPEGLADL